MLRQLVGARLPGHEGRVGVAHFPPRPHAGRIGSELGPKGPQTGGADCAPTCAFDSARPDVSRQACPHPLTSRQRSFI